MSHCDACGNLKILRKIHVWWLCRDCGFSFLSEGKDYFLTHNPKLAAGAAPTEGDEK